MPSRLGVLVVALVVGCSRSSSGDEAGAPAGSSRPAPPAILVPPLETMPPRPSVLVVPSGVEILAEVQPGPPGLGRFASDESNVYMRWDGPPAGAPVLLRVAKRGGPVAVVYRAPRDVALSAWIAVDQKNVVVLNLRAAHIETSHAFYAKPGFVFVSKSTGAATASLAAEELNNPFAEGHLEDDGVYVKAIDKLLAFSAGGGPPRLVYERDPNDKRSIGDFVGDATSLYVAKGGTILRVPKSGKGTTTALYADPEAPTTIRFVRDIFRRGDDLIFLHGQPYLRTTTVETVKTSGGPPRTIFAVEAAETAHFAMKGGYAADERYFYFGADTMTTATTVGGAPVIVRVPLAGGAPELVVTFPESLRCRPSYISVDDGGIYAGLDCNVLVRIDKSATGLVVRRKS